MNKKTFVAGNWNYNIDVENFIDLNCIPYRGGDEFLSGPSKKTQKVWKKCQSLLKEEQFNDGLLDVDLKHLAGINNFKPGYIDKKNEVIVGLQTDAPLKRMINPFGGLRMVEQSLKAYGKKMPKKLKKQFAELRRKTHNEGVFDVYTPEIRAARHNGLITGLPDAYGRGRVIGDYRRVALYGTERLIKDKVDCLENIQAYDEHSIRLREEIADQIKALKDMTEMAAGYGVDISKPAYTAKEAVQAVYMAYLAGVKENNGAANSLGRVSTFFDIYIEKDLEAGIITEKEAQELIDQFVIKLRLVRHLRTPEYNELFGGDPTWVTESIGGMNGFSSQTFVTKTSFRMLNTLINLGPAPEPNLTVLWSNRLPRAFKEYCAKISLLTDSIQYENDDLMRNYSGSDYGISCCVSALDIGKESQFFGARCNIAKALLYAINGGRDEKTGHVVLTDIPALPLGKLKYEDVLENYKKVLKQTVDIYVGANNIIHYMHDKYAYEASQMALIDSPANYLMAFGIAGFSVAVDSLSAIKHAEVTPIRNKNGIATGFSIKGDFPKYGNDDDRVDNLGKMLITEFNNLLFQKELYKNAKPTLSILTITSNVMYGKKTGATPDGRLDGEPFAPGANPMHGRDEEGAIASLNSVSKIPYSECRDGISNTITFTPQSLGSTQKIQIDNLVAILDGYFSLKGHHLNVNILQPETLINAHLHPENYPNLTIRVSGYAVNFCKLSPEQRLEVIARTFHNQT